MSVLGCRVLVLMVVVAFERVVDTGDSSLCRMRPLGLLMLLLEEEEVADEAEEEVWFIVVL